MESVVLLISASAVAMTSEHSIPKSQRAFVLPEVGGTPSLLTDHPVVQPKDLPPGQCLVNITHSGVCHSDIGVKNGTVGHRAKDNLVGGHEGVGTVVAIGEHTVGTHIKVGQRVGLKFIAKACYSCEMCLKGSETRQSFSAIYLYKIDGRVSHVTFSQIAPNLRATDKIGMGPSVNTLWQTYRQ